MPSALLTALVMSPAAAKNQANQGKKWRYMRGQYEQSILSRCLWVGPFKNVFYLNSQHVTPTGLPLGLVEAKCLFAVKISPSM